ncbi:MAG: GtrA family protein [Acidimicrobiales bacterium]
MSVRDVVAQARTPMGRKMIRYACVSGVSVVVGQATLIIGFGVIGWSARAANVVSFIAGGIPSYYLNRAWTWSKHGRSHVVKEVLPFWILAFAGLALSTWAVGVVEDHATSYSKLVQTILVSGTSIAAFGVIWVVKFIVFEKFMFGKRPEPEPEPATTET